MYSVPPIRDNAMDSVADHPTGELLSPLNIHVLLSEMSHLFKCMFS